MSLLNNLFMILILISILIIILGLIKPSMVKMHSRKNVLIRGVLLFIVSFVLFGITAPDPNDEVSEPKMKQSTEDKKDEADRIEAEEKAEVEAQKAKVLEEQKAQELEEQKRQEELGKQQAAEEEKRKAEEDAALRAKEEAAAKAEANTPIVERFKNCTEMRKVYPNGVPSTHPAYESKHDRDKDNHACEQ
jgi:flagellar biosynthesis protein FliP